jgi:poly(3-hydroxyalkanoate) synthetase
MKLLIIHFSVASYYFIPLGSKHSAQHHILKHHQFMFFTCISEPYKTAGKNEVLVYVYAYVGTECLHEISNANGVRVVNFATCRMKLSGLQCSHIIKSIKFTWTSHDGKTHNQINRIFVYKRWHSVVLDVRSFWGDHCDVYRYLVVGKQATDWQ